MVNIRFGALIFFIAIVLTTMVPLLSAATTSDLLYSTYFSPLSRVCYKDCAASASKCSCQILDRVVGLDFPGEIILYRSQEWHSTQLKSIIEPLVEKSANCLKSCSMSTYYKPGCSLQSCPWYVCAQSCIKEFKGSVNSVVSPVITPTKTLTRTGTSTLSTLTIAKTSKTTQQSRTITGYPVTTRPIPSPTPTKEKINNLIIGLDNSAVTDTYLQETGEEWDGRKEDCPVYRGNDWSGTGGYYLSHGGDRITFKITIPASDNYSLWLRDNSDNVHIAGARNVIILIDGNEAGEVDAATANAEGGTPGYGWHKTINTQLTAGEHLITIMKSETTAAAAIIDAIELSNNPDFVPAGPVNHSTRECKTITPTNTQTFTSSPTPTSPVTFITPSPSNTICPECSRCICASCPGYMNSANMNEEDDIKPGSIGLSLTKAADGTITAIVPRIWLSNGERVIDSYLERDGVLFSRPPQIITNPGTYKNLKLIVKTENANYIAGDANEIIIPEHTGCHICTSCKCPTCPEVSYAPQTFVTKMTFTYEPYMPHPTMSQSIWPLKTIAPVISWGGFKYK